MNTRASVPGTVMVYIILLIAGMIILIILFQLFTPYKITSLLDGLFNSSGKFTNSSGRLT
jgi:VanZ family protein